MRVLKKRG